MRTEIVIAVKEVRESAAWYEQLLGCHSSHGGNTFEILRNAAEQVVLCLHHWGEHGHPTLSDPGVTAGNGLIIYFKTDDLYAVWKRAQALNAFVEEAPHLNTNSGKEEFSIRDRDGYFISVSF